MKKRLSLAFLIITLACSQVPAYAQTEKFNITYPFLDNPEYMLIKNPYLQKTFLEYLKDNSVLPVIDSDGLPLFYYSENASYGCSGICPNITMNNYTFGSKQLNLSSVGPGNILGESVIVGGKGVQDSMDAINSIRTGLNDNPLALAEFEKHLLEMQEDYATNLYYQNAYDDVWDFALDDLKTDPDLYNSLLKDIRNQDIGSSMGDLEKYLKENFDINSAYDLSSMFSAIENKQIGQAQLDEYMRNILDRIAEQENVDINLDDLDLSQFSDLMNTDEFKEIMERALEEMKENPEALEKLKDLANEMMQRPETREIFKEALKEMMEEADWDTIKDLMDVFNEMENKDELMKTMMETFSEYMRDMVAEGRIDELQEMLFDENMQEMLNEAVKSFQEDIFDNVGDFFSNIPIELAYIVAIAAIIATLLLFMKMKI